jgi:ribosomal protein L11 methyltransferase
MKQYVKVTVRCSSAEVAEMVMATLTDNDFYAFDQEDAVLNAYIHLEDFDENFVRELLVGQPDFSFEAIEDRNWNAEWESNFHPVVINDFVGIRAAFHRPVVNVTHDLIITPKMSFGTGHHATTCLMIEMMQRIDFRGKSVVDFGTGTGILAILAEKLGAASILAIDSDEWSVSNATENVEANSCSKIIVEQKNTIACHFYVEVILANINRSVLEENVKAFSSLLRKDTVLVISGILTSDLHAIVSAFTQNGWVNKQILEQEGWVALLFEQREN